MRIGIYGGSFNPVHKQHEQIARTLVSHDYVDKVILVPASGQYVKAGLLPFNERFDMLSDVFKGDTGAVKVSKLEESRSFKTLEVMNHFQDEYQDAEIYYILGADNLLELDTWYEYETLLSKYKILVIERDDIDCKSVVSSKYAKYASNIVYAKIPQVSISSRMIRHEILQNGFSDLVLSMINPIVAKKLQKIDYRKYWI